MAESAESLADLYWAKLRTTTNASLTLANFYSALTDKPIGRSEIILFNRLLKTFGKSIVYLSIVDISRVDNISEFPYGLLFKICKDRLEATLSADMTSASSDNLDRRINKMLDDISKVKKIDPSRAGKFLGDEENGDNK